MSIGSDGWYGIWLTRRSGSSWQTAAIGIFLWSLWCLEYIFGILLLGMTHQRQMYAIKQQRRWYVGECHTAVAVDTRVSAMAGHFPVSAEDFSRNRADGCFL